MATYSLIFLYFLIITCFITKCSPDIIILCKDFALISINLFLFFKIRWSIPSKMACCFKWSLNTYNANTYSRKIKLNPSHIQFKIINMVSKKFKKSNFSERPQTIPKHDWTCYGLFLAISEQFYCVPNFRYCSPNMPFQTVLMGTLVH